MPKINLIDTHAHFNTLLMPNLEEQLQLAKKNEDVSKIINVGLNPKTSQDALNISLKYSNFYATLGVHPLYDGQIETLEKIYTTYNHKKIVAIGETGIDTQGDIKVQIKNFIKSIELANQLKLPVIIHAHTTKNASIYASRLCLEIMKKHKPHYGFVFHYFQPDLEILPEINNLEGYVSVGANITKPNAKKSLEVVKTMPLEKLLIETDYPFLAKEPNNTGKETFQKICELTNMPKKVLMKTLNQNATTLFQNLKNK